MSSNLPPGYCDETHSWRGFAAGNAGEPPFPRPIAPAIRTAAEPVAAGETAGLLEKLAKWEALAKAATMGPWESRKGYVGGNHAAFLSNDGIYDGIHIHWGEERHGNGNEESFATADFMAHGHPDFVQDIIAEFRAALTTRATPATPAFREAWVAHPVDFNLPYEDSKCLVYSRRLNSWHRGYRMGLNDFMVEGHGIDSTVTHYADLPAAPAQKGGEQI